MNDKPDIISPEGVVSDALAAPGPHHTSHRRRTIIIVVVTLLLLIFAAGAFFSGVLLFAYSAVRCGKAPIAASDFAAGFSYYRPGDPNYGPSLFNDHYFCSEAEAIAGGYRGLPGSLSDQRVKQLAESDAIAAQFGAAKVPYIAYYPTYVPVGYVLGAPAIEDFQGPQVLQYLTIHSQSAILLRQGVAASTYSACKLAPCTPVGKDNLGRVVYMSTSPSNGSTFWGIMLSNSYVNIETTKGSELSQAEVIKIFSSLSPLT